MAVEDGVRVDAGPSTGPTTGPDLMDEFVTTTPPIYIPPVQRVKEIIATTPTTISVGGLRAEDQLTENVVTAARVEATRRRYVEAVRIVQEEGTYVTAKREGVGTPISIDAPLARVVDRPTYTAPIRTDWRYDIL